MPGSTPIYGFPYPEATDLVADYPALGQELAEDVETAIAGSGGMSGVAPTSIANTGGSASTTNNTTTFTGVTSLSLNGVFSAAFRDYRVVLSVAASAGTPNLSLRYRAAGVDRTGAVYTYSQNYGTGANNATAQTSILHASTSTELNPVIWDVLSPFLTADTHGAGLNQRNVSPTMFMMGHLQNEAVSVDGFTIYGATFTGTVSVYGYKA